MASVRFFEKPGCANNTRQKKWLEAAGHHVEAHSLLSHPWTAEELRAYFGARPVAAWFNRAAPRVKSGELVPEQCTADEALALMLREPLLIRRPLIEAAGRREVGFDVAEIHAWLGLPESVLAEHAPSNAASNAPKDAEACLKGNSAPACRAHDER